MIFPMLRNEERSISAAKTTAVEGRGAVPRLRAELHLDCGHVVEVDYRHEGRGTLSHARAVMQHAHLMQAGTMVCPRCPLPP